MTRLSSLAAAALRRVALTVGSVAAACAVLSQFGRWSPRLDILTHFAPFWFAGALVLALAAGTSPRGRWRRVLFAASVAGLASAAGLMAPEFLQPRATPTTAPERARIRLIQFNTWEKNQDPAGTADWIVTRKPDLVAVEEVTPALAQALMKRGFHYNRGMVTTAIFSRLPRASRQLPVPTGYWKLLPDFARRAFAAPGGAGDFGVVVAHPAWPVYGASWSGNAALARLLDLYSHDRLIVVGDFNLTPWSFGLARLDLGIGLPRLDRAIPTWPARPQFGGLALAPVVPAFLPIDHVYAGPAWRVVQIRRGPRLGSDHYPLVIDLALMR